MKNNEKSQRSLPSDMRRFLPPKQRLQPIKTRYSDIPYPTTKAEQRENLGKYFCWTLIDGEKHLLVKYGGKIEPTKISEIDSFTDLYSRGFDFGSQITPELIPSFAFNEGVFNERERAERRVMLRRDYWDVMNDTSKVRIYELNTERQVARFRACYKSDWMKIDHQYSRGFFVRLLGEFTGYKVSETRSSALWFHFDWLKETQEAFIQDVIDGRTANIMTVSYEANDSLDKHLTKYYDHYIHHFEVESLDYEHPNSEGNESEYLAKLCKDWEPQFVGDEITMSVGFGG